MAARASTVAQAFSNKVMRWMYDISNLDSIVNRDYEGEINGVGSKINILDFDRVSEKDYAGVPLTADDLTENNGVLTIDKKKSFYFKEKTLDNWLSYIKDPHPTIVTQTAGERARNMELYVYAKYANVAAGNRVGTDVTTGTVTIDASGNVTGAGTTFTAGMVGRGFKAAGHTKWYRVKTFTSTTVIVIEDDLDDTTSAYTGGVIAALATFTVEAVTAVAISASNVLTKVALMKQKLDLQEKLSKVAVPDTDRWLLVPPEFETSVINGSGIALHVDAVYSELVKQGFLGELQGFKIFKTNRLSGDNTNGYHLLAGHPGWMTMAEKVLKARIEEDLIGDFGVAYKDLFVYGSKVKDQRRGFATEMFATFS